MTNFLHRVLILCPAARQAAFNTWANANLDPAGGSWFTVGLSATGNIPATFYACNAALTAPQLKLLMQRLCTLASITPPAGWDGLTRTQQKQWLIDQRSAIFNATGIRIRVADNDGTWDDPQGELTQDGLLAIASAST